MNGMNAKTIWELLKQTFSEWSEDKVPRLGAALAYYSVFSLAPLLLVVIAVAGVFFGREAAQGKIIEELQGLLGTEAAQAINKMLESAAQPTDGLIASAIGIFLLLLGATGVFGQLQDALNTIWEVAPKPGRGLIGIIRDRFLSLAVVAGTAFLLLVSLVVSAGLSALNSTYGSSWSPLVGQSINMIVSFAVTTVLFGMIYKILPDAQIGWRDIWLGAAITSLLFTVGKFLISLYIAHGSVASVYGAAGSFVVILIWVYYSSQILLFGAEFTQVYASKFGSRIVPSSNAVALTSDRRAQQGIPSQAKLKECATGSNNSGKRRH
jgi:membrane protein